MIPVYLINLDTDEDRRERMATQFVRLGMTFDRFPAIRGADLPEWARPYLENAPISAGEKGCYASHLAVMRMIAEGEEPALVLEDDVTLKPELPALIQEMLSDPQPWDIIRLVSNQDKSPRIECGKLSGGYSMVKFVRVPVNAGAYLITPEGARKFLEWRTPRSRPLDIDLRRVWDHGLITLGVSPLPVTSNAGPSSIDQIGIRDKRQKFGSFIEKRVDQARRFAYNLSDIGPSAMVRSLIS